MIDWSYWYDIVCTPSPSLKKVAEDAGPGLRTADGGRPVPSRPAADRCHRSPRRRDLVRNRAAVPGGTPRARARRPPRGLRVGRCQASAGHCVGGRVEEEQQQERAPPATGQFFLRRRRSLHFVRWLVYLLWYLFFFHIFSHIPYFLMYDIFLIYLFFDIFSSLISSFVVFVLQLIATFFLSFLNIPSRFTASDNVSSCLVMLLHIDW